ncbi:hormonally up-regulated neu tumor-associated kinase-like [Sycon ciliatum]|uniref:hormonally up-regulated neu tumor-associated kinase-like n=1 Tax=Sycon ciliatum TaxID=27933 RepID=UPI0031F6BCAC
MYGTTRIGKENRPRGFARRTWSSCREFEHPQSDQDTLPRIWCDAWGALWSALPACYRYPMRFAQFKHLAIHLKRELTAIEKGRASLTSSSFSNYLLGMGSGDSALRTLREVASAPETSAKPENKEQESEPEPQPQQAQACKGSANTAGATSDQASAKNDPEPGSEPRGQDSPPSPVIMSDQVELVTVDDCSKVVTFEQELHRKTGDKCVVVRVRAKAKLGRVPKGTEMVLKVIKNRRSTTEEAFIKEHRTHVACCARRHANILACYPFRFQTASKSHFGLVTEVSVGGSLTHMRPTHQIVEAERIILGMAKALEHIHGCGFVHCDVKRENILFDAPEDGGANQYRLMDFGSARTLGDWYPQSNSGYTTVYAPPEIFPEHKEVKRADRKKYRGGQALDVWELGITALFLCHIHLWREASANCVAYTSYATAVEAGVPVTHLFADLPKSLRHIVPSMLHPSPEKRCTIQEIIQHLL